MCNVGYTYFFWVVIISQIMAIWNLYIEKENFLLFILNIFTYILPTSSTEKYAHICDLQSK